MERRRSGGSRGRGEREEEVKEWQQGKVNRWQKEEKRKRERGSKKVKDE